NKRISYSLNFGFSHTVYENELQNGVGSTQYNGRNDYAGMGASSKTYPYGYVSALDWFNSNYEYPPSQYLMTYRLFTISSSFSLGYTQIFDVGRLGYSGGVSVSYNKAVYDTNKFMPYERLISKYEEGGFSNKITFGIQWDGRDYITNTTKGYVVSVSTTYAGGLLGGLSNYIKVGGTAAGYLRLKEFVLKDESTKNLMLCVSTSMSSMLKQFYYNNEDLDRPGMGFHDPKLGATKYEMLYIDGMTNGRGHVPVTDQAFLWDNMIEISYPLVENVVQSEAFISATGVNSSLSDIKNGINWYISAGFGIKLKIAGFPLGLYVVKNGTYKFENGESERTFNWLPGSMFNTGKENSGMSLVLAISTSLI
ncbi:MAG: BamA/TamA family outer membrane protein, partial [Sphaerochaetaceae bacterium]|nr:BamA/TamA family outer membrane protein [Sphaerochaetaceae bacterium]